MRVDIRWNLTFVNISKKNKKGDLHMVKDDKDGKDDMYEQIHEDLLKMVPKIRFDETNLKNVIYKEVIQILEPLEAKEKYKGNAHHLTQDIVEKVSAAIMEKMDIPKR